MSSRMTRGVSGDGWGRARKGSGTRGVAVEGEGMLLRRPPLSDEAHPQQDPQNEGNGEDETGQLQGGQDDPYQVKRGLLDPDPGRGGRGRRQRLPSLSATVDRRLEPVNCRVWVRLKASR